MKRFLTAFILLLAFNYSFGQVHWIMNPDPVPNCEMIKSGKFVNKITNDIATEGYYIIFEEGYATEYVEGGRYYLKSKIDFITDCQYRSTVIEVTIPNSDVEVGTVIFTKILTTSTVDKLLKIESISEDQSYSFVLEKVEE